MIPSPPTLTASAWEGASSPPSRRSWPARARSTERLACAIFADIRWESPSVCKHIEWLKDRLSFRLSFIDNARGLREDVMALTNHSGSRNYMDIPVYLKGRDREGDGIER